MVVGGAWAFVANRADGTVTEIDRVSARAVATVPVADPKGLLEQGCNPGSEHAYYYGSWGLRECDTPFTIGWDGATLWAIDDATPALVGLDPAARTVSRRIPLPHRAWDVAFTAGTAWLSGYWDDRVFAVDLATGGVAVDRPVPCHGPAAIATAASGVWTVCARSGDLLRLDTSGGVGARAAIAPWSIGLAARGGELYLRGAAGGDLSRIDAQSAAAVWTSSAAPFVGDNGLDAMAPIGGGVWLSGPETTLIDSTGKVRERLPRTSKAVAGDAGELWLLGADGAATKLTRG